MRQSRILYAGLVPGVLLISLWAGRAELGRNQSFDLLKPPQKQTKFMKEGEIEHKGGFAKVRANHPRPLWQAIIAISQEYGWVVDYEDPPYASAPDLVDDTAPQWRTAHPGARGVTVPAGGLFECEFQEGSMIATAGGEESTLRKIVAEYNRSANPGKFILRAEGEGRFAVVGQSIKHQGKDQEIGPVLDTVISMRRELRSAEETIGIILKEVSIKSGKKVLPPGWPSNLLSQAQVTVGGENVTARSLLIETINQVGRPLRWSLLYDADVPSYVLNVGAATLAQRNTYGKRVLVPIDFAGPKRGN